MGGDTCDVWVEESDDVTRSVQKQNGMKINKKINKGEEGGMGL